ncbi:MAG TPA: HisA/HisF-related TIM barrel protein, partial [Chitinophagaceae bacterium]|nr:HisA/HisF-related TIM barrel protein [Chitinophagaceae bacterium]
IAGAGEILLNNINRDGTFEGYDTNLIQQVSNAVTIPVIALGGAASLQDFSKACHAGASALAAGSMFVLQRPHQAVLISYPNYNELKNITNE